MFDVIWRFLNNRCFWKKLHSNNFEHGPFQVKTSSDLLSESKIHWEYFLRKNAYFKWFKIICWILLNTFPVIDADINEPFLDLSLEALCRSETSQGYLCGGAGFPGISLFLDNHSLYTSFSSSHSLILFSLSPIFIELAPSSASLKPHKGLRLSHSSTEHDISRPTVLSFQAFSFAILQLSSKL